MTGVSRQKQKLLTMKKLFETKTDEKHTITGNRPIEILGDYGIKAERKTIYDDTAMCSGWSGKISSDCTSLTTQPSSCTPDLFSFSMASCMTGSGVAS